MFLKPILMLVLFIAIAALGSNYVGDGLFDFQKKAKAARLVEFTRDIATVMQTYKADQASNLSLPYVIDNEVEAAGADSEGTVGNGVVAKNDVINALKADKLIKGDGNPDFGDIAFGRATDLGQTDVVIVNSSIEISNEICAKINEVLGVGDPAADNKVELDISALSQDTSGGTILTADADALAVTINAGGQGNITNGGVEGVCVQDSTGTVDNTFVFYVQEF